MQTPTKKLFIGCVAIASITGSLLFWTGVVDWVVRVSREIVVDAGLVEPGWEEIVVQRLDMREPKQSVHLDERNISVTATISAQAREQKREIRAAAVEEHAADAPPEATEHGAADELRRWELVRSWSISIPSIGIRAPVIMPSLTFWRGQEWDLLEEQMQVGLAYGAVAYPHSVSPGEKGNVIIAGHSSPPDDRAERSDYGNLFSRLPELQPGDTISLLGNGAPVVYRVEGKQIVSPKQTSILESQGDDRVLKLITCFPIGTTRDRLIIVAREVTEL